MLETIITAISGIQNWWGMFFFIGLPIITMVAVAVASHKFGWE